MPSLQPAKRRGKTYWRIVESRRVNGQPRAVQIAYLGSVEKILSMFREGNAVSVKSFQHGNVAALKAVADRLGIAKLIDKYVGRGCNGVSVGETLVLSAINRACQPRSKRGFTEWAAETSLGKLFPNINMGKMTSAFFWDQMNRVSEVDLELIEEELSAKLVKDSNLSLGTLLYDTTNFFTYIASDNECSELAQRGHNKQKRYDLRQLNLAVLMSRQDQIPLLSCVYEGNTPDVSRFETSLTAIRKRLEAIVKDISQVTIIYDKGNNSEKNQQAIDESEVGFIAPISPIHSPGGLMEVSLKDFQKMPEGLLKGVEFYRTKRDIWGKKRTVVMFVSIKLREGQQRGLQQSLQTALSALQKWKDRLRKPNSGPRSEKAVTLQVEKILKGSFVKQVLKVTYSRRKKGAARLTWFVDSEKLEYLETEVFGRRVLMTNRHDWTTADIIDACHSQSDLENSFRQLKDPEHFAVRPQYHWTDQKIRVHVFICMLALVMGRAVEKEARNLGLKESLSHLMDRLATIRLSVMIGKSQIKKHNSKSDKGKVGVTDLNVRWMLEQARPKTMSLYEALTPTDSRLVYTKSADISL